MADNGLPELGRFFLIVGGLLVVVGLLLTFAGKVPWLGRLPGDIVFRKGNFTFYFPLVTSLLLSLLLTLVFSLFRR
jgi:membrane protein implicated in regulation of membrane protease activity